MGKCEVLLHLSGKSTSRELHSFERNSLFDLRLRIRTSNASSRLIAPSRLRTRAPNSKQRSRPHECGPVPCLRFQRQCPTEPSNCPDVCTSTLRGDRRYTRPC